MRERGGSMDGGRSAGAPATSNELELDLRGVRCPLNWAHAKVRLEELRPGDSLTLVLDDPKGVRDIPRAAEAEGYSAGEPEPVESHWRLTIWV